MSESLKNKLPDKRPRLWVMRKIPSTINYDGFSGSELEAHRTSLQKIIGNLQEKRGATDPVELQTAFDQQSGRLARVEELLEERGLKSKASG